MLKFIYHFKQFSKFFLHLVNKTPKFTKRFVLLSYLLTHHRLRYIVQAKGYFLDRIMGGVLLLLALQLVLSDLS